VSAYSQGAAKVLYSSVELGKLEPRQSDTNVKQIRPVYGPALLFGRAARLAYNVGFATPSMLDNTGAAALAEKQETRVNGSGDHVTQFWLSALAHLFRRQTV
jgi:hypothetical protein